MQVIRLALTITLTLSLGMLHASEITFDHIIKAVAQVETGVTWVRTGVIVGRWRTGGAGEVSPWQLSPALLRDLGELGHRGRIARDPALSEQIFKRVYWRLYSRLGSHEAALGAYHRGLGSRTSPDAVDYAQRVLNLVHSYEAE